MDNVSTPKCYIGRNPTKGIESCMALYITTIGNLRVSLHWKKSHKGVKSTQTTSVDVQRTVKCRNKTPGKGVSWGFEGGT